MLPPSVWPMVLGQQERGHERNPHTFTGLQAVRAGILTETVRDADEGRGGNVEEGGSSLEGGQRLQETLGVGVLGAHRTSETRPTRAHHGQAKAAPLERLGGAAQDAAFAMREDEAP